MDLNPLKKEYILMIRSILKNVINVAEKMSVLDANLIYGLENNNLFE